jgi:hypothetical protein
MGCAESREKITVSSFSFTKSPLPLYIYPNSDGIGPYTIKTPKSSPKSSITTSVTTSVTTSLITSPVPSPKNVSPTNATTVATSYVSRLTSIAHRKFSMFNEFPKNVQTEILHHIDKELRKQ